MYGSLHVSRLPRPVIFDRYVVCQDYWHEAGRLYLARGDGEHSSWERLGESIFVYPNPAAGTVCIDFPRMHGINTSEAELDRHDGHSFSLELLSAGYKPEQGMSWYILDYIRTAVERGVAVTPHGVVDASEWPGLVYLRMNRLGWFDKAKAARKAKEASAGRMV